MKEADSLLMAVWELLKNKGECLDDPRKESHQGKALERHINECYKFAKRILDQYVKNSFTGLPKDLLYRFCLGLCALHDVGKLDPKWGINKEKNIKHSERSFELLLRHKEDVTKILSLFDNYFPLLLFSVLKHHSSLYINEYKKEEKELCVQIDNLLSGNRYLSITLADIIGIFKLSDIVSALNIDEKHQELILEQFKPFNSMKYLKNSIRKWVSKKELSFDHEKFKVQQQVSSLASRHVILAAPTGWGKTITALLRINYLRPNKVFYILPTITAIKEFQERLKDVFPSHYIGEYFYFADVEYLLHKNDIDEPVFYPMNFYRYFIPKITITTVDQLLFSALQFGRYHLRRYNLKNALLIFDEFHLLTPEMIGALKAIFNFLSDIYNLSTMFMSATPHLGYADILKEVLDKQGGVKTNILLNEYAKTKRHKIKMLDNTTVSDLLQTQDINSLLNNGKNILIIVNTVDRAVKIYDELKNNVQINSPSLIHSRFTYVDRMKKEEEIGKTNILVSTQVAEVSLDISYDILITELAPLPSLLQRFGRVNRYGEKISTTENVYVCTPEDVRPYLRIELELTKELFPELETNLQSHNEVIYPNIIKEYYEKLCEEVENRINKFFNLVKKRLDDNMYFYRLKGELPKEILGRESSYLVIPQCYYEEVKKIKENMKGKNYEEIMRLLAQLKTFFVPVQNYILEEDGEMDEELGLFIVGRKGKYYYSSDRGLIKQGT